MKAKPQLNLERRDGLAFKTPASALAKWNRAIQCKANGPAEISILGEIGPEEWGGTSARTVKAALDDAKGAALLINLNSPGGDAFEGVAIYNLLREHKGRITVNVLGLAASAASIVAMAGDEIRIGEAAMLMIHSAWGLVAGNKNDMREFADVLDKIDANVAGLYAARTGLPVKEVLSMMEKETWLDAEQAVALGFADSAVADSSNAKVHAVRPSSLALGPLPAMSAAAVRMSASSPAVAGSIPLKGNAMNQAEYLASLEAKRAATAAQMSAIPETAQTEGRSLTAEEQTQFDELESEINNLDETIKRTKRAQALMASTATPIQAAAVQSPEEGARVRQPNSGITHVRQNLAPGVKMARFAMALARARGNIGEAASIVKNERRWMDTSPELHQVMMTAVAAGDTSTAGWASELAYQNNLAAEFIEYLRPKTIIGRIPGLRMVPFNIRVGSQTAGGTGYWIGQGAPVPLSKLTTSETTLGIAKAAGMMVITDELARNSTPSAEMLVRDDLTRTVQQFLDQQFIDPNVAAVANINPASITNGVTPVTPTGTTLAALKKDIQSLIDNWTENNLDMTGGVWIMPATMAYALSQMQNALGQPEFPQVNINGGTFMGLPVVTSQLANITGSPSSGNMIILVNAPEVFVADEGQIGLEVSNQASIQMLDNPTNNSVSGTATAMVSMFQTNSWAIKAVRYINWTKRRSFAVQYIENAAYVIE